MNGGHRRTRAGLTWTDRVAGVRVRTLVALAAALLVALATLLVLPAARPDHAADAAAPSAAAPSAVAPSAVASAPAVPDAHGAPQPGPTPASDPAAQAQASSRYGLNAQALLDEMRKHDPNITDDEVGKLVAIGDRGVARGQADLTATDPAITADIAAAFPQASPDQRATMTRCTAEYVEREIALLRHTSPPDESDDHTGG